MYSDSDLIGGWMDDPWIAAHAVYEAPIGLPGYCCGLSGEPPPVVTEDPPGYVPPGYVPPGYVPPTIDPTCPPGFVRNVLGQCVPVCPPGQVADPNGRCIPPSTGACPPGYSMLPDGRCVTRATPPSIPRTCPPGYTLASDGNCYVRATPPTFPGQPTQPTCPPDHFYNAPTGTCVPYLY